MKKLLNILTLATLSTSAIPTVAMVLNSNVVKNLNLKDNPPVKDNPFISQITGTSGPTCSLATDKDGNIFAGTVNNIVYKSNGTNAFTAMTGTSEIINVLATDKDGNIFAGSHNGIFKCLSGQTNFTAIKGISGEFHSLVIDNQDNIYAGTTDTIYKCLAGQTSFTTMTGTSGWISSLTVDNSGTVYAGSYTGSDDGAVYKCLAGQTSFTAMSGIGGPIRSLATDGRGNIYAGTENNIVYKSNGTDPFTAMSGTSGRIISLTTDGNGTVYAGSYTGSDDGAVYKCLAGQTSFTAMSGIGGPIRSLATDGNGTVYAGSNDKVYKFDLLDNLLKVNNPNYYGPKYNGFVYNQQQTIDLKKDYLKSATLDGKSLTIPSTNIPIATGKHTLVLTVKDDVKQYLDLFGGYTSTGVITYNFWIKTAIETNKINYSTNQDDTDLTDLSLGFVSTEGNTKNCSIIETKAKDGTGVHPANLNLKLNDILIDLNKSYYVKGTVDTSKNDFIENSSTKKPVPKNLVITTDGIYHLHLVDVVGNVYDSYLELGVANWQLKGTFNDKELNRLKNELDVEVNLTDPKQLSLATGWLSKYEHFVQQNLNSNIEKYGKGFDNEIKNNIGNKYKWFLNSLTYLPNHEPDFDNGIDKVKLEKGISDLANQMLKDGLANLPSKDFNVYTSNVVNRQTLDSYTSWINGYQNFINKNKDIWFNQVTDVSSRGFATDQQIQQIKQYLNGLDFSDYLQRVTWKPNSMLATSNDYKQFILLDKLQADTINWVNQNIPDINQAYQNAIQKGERNLNLHGYKLSDLLNGKQLPQTKNQIDNYKDGLSFHDWLQAQADGYYHTWQLKMGLGIGLPLLAVASFGIWLLYLRYSHKHRPIRRADNKYNPVKKVKREAKALKKEQTNHKE